ncbi:hypothetical protein TTHERM_000145549 (macronuclear) [Tetrahymena thermophila SB210]|uniref:Uncharacterized protein n=1 Tax=Tetrahymena thermophila (strain SB210) TaxID=312017 RepID=W7XJM4_TETTS|nr:hypothetical protein TTHERM_000145549 [Tetrahymena thermophila SB210]EWS75666.1 hypothetical protein TTHERM_000145549 [Tetrahymena thermophila SB210]|eukprot:XP_012651812.1 hypothetical protein TTHERM_000145549 [Tetrahymena thermophila SB210]
MLCSVNKNRLQIMLRSKKAKATKHLFLFQIKRIQIQHKFKMQNLSRQIIQTILYNKYLRAIQQKIKQKLSTKSNKYQINKFKSIKIVFIMDCRKLYLGSNLEQNKIAIQYRKQPLKICQNLIKASCQI